MRSRLFASTAAAGGGLALAFYGHDDTQNLGAALLRRRVALCAETEENAGSGSGSGGGGGGGDVEGENLSLAMLQRCEVQVRPLSVHAELGFLLLLVDEVLPHFIAPPTLAGQRAREVARVGRGLRIWGLRV